MKTASVSIVASLFAAVLLVPAGCSPTTADETHNAPHKPEAQHGLDALGVSAAASPLGNASARSGGGMTAGGMTADGMLHGTVLETMDTGGYTYVLVDGGGTQAWAAAPEFDISVGTRVAVSTQMPMANYTSSTLNRTFDLVYFVGEVVVEGAPGQGMAAQSTPAAAMSDVGATHNTAPAIAIAGVTPVDGGKTVAAVFAEAASLSGNEIALRGKVVKFVPGVMGRNWIHVKDGTGSAGTDDLTVTTQDTVTVGDTVLVRGTVAVAQDFGFGYSYDVLVEKASVTIE